MGYKLDWQYFSKNTTGRDLVCGDIHGNFDLFDKQLEEINFEPNNDRIFVLGDIIDRGPRSVDCLDYYEKPWFFSIKGNHEQMAIDSFKNNEYHFHVPNGGKWFEDLSLIEQEKYVNHFNKLPYVIEIETNNGIIGLVHANVNTIDWHDFKFKFDEYKEDSIWGRSRYMAALAQVNTRIKNIDHVIFGHSGVYSPLYSENMIFIDTGYKSSRLCFLEINNDSGIKIHHTRIISPIDIRL